MTTNTNDAPRFRQEMMMIPKNDDSNLPVSPPEKPPPENHHPVTTTMILPDDDDDEPGDVSSTTATTATTTCTTVATTCTTAAASAPPQQQQQHETDDHRPMTRRRRHTWNMEPHVNHLRSVERQTILQYLSIPSSSSSSSLSSPTTTANDATQDLTATTTPLPSSLNRDSSHNSHHSSVTTPLHDSSTHHHTPATHGDRRRLLVVTGPTGVGKAQLLSNSISPPAWTMRGTFDVGQHADPYRVYTMAVTDFVQQVLLLPQRQPSSSSSSSLQQDTTLKMRLRHAIQSACGEEIQVLIQMIPSLAAILNEEEEMKDDRPLEKASGPFVSSPNVTTTTTTNSNNNAMEAPPRSTPPPPPVQQDDATQRFVFVLQTFLRAVASVVQNLIVQLEQIQYADDCSIDVLVSILTTTEDIPGLMVVTTYNGTDLPSNNHNTSTSTNMNHHHHHHDGDDTNNNNDNHRQNEKTSYFVESILKMQQRHHHHHHHSCSEGSSSPTIHVLGLENFQPEQVQYLLNQTLQPPSSRFDLPVDESFCTLVMEQTSGNWYQIVEFLHWLEDHQLLTTNGPSSPSNTIHHHHPSSQEYTYWTWNIDAIRRAVHEARSSSTTTPFFMSHRLEQVPPDTMEVLKVGACLGSARISDMLLGFVLDYPIHHCLTEAVEMDLLVHLNDGEGKQYAFAHENIQTLVYRLISEKDRELFHLEIGRRLWRRFDHDELDRHIFVVLSQIWIGRRLISRLSERYKIAALCLHAGRKAAKSSSFRISLIYLRFGIELLGGGEGAWRDEYNLTLLLHNATAEMEVCNANVERMELLMTNILRYSRCAEDTIQARTTQVYAFGVSDRQQDGLDLGIQILSDLGFGFPSKFCRWSLRSEMKKILLLLRGKSDDYIKRLPVINDEKVLAAMHVLNMMFLHAVLVRPLLSGFVTLKMMNLTMTHGLCFMSPLAFATFGMLCVQCFPTPDNALRYGELGLELLDMFQVREYLPRIYAAYYACIRPWKHPLPESLNFLTHAQRVGMQTGDVEFAGLCANLWGYIAMDTDIPLDKIEHHWSTFQSTLKSRRQASILRMSVTCIQAIQHLQGKDVDLTVTEKLLQHSIDNHIASTMTGIRWNNAKTAFLFNDLLRADEYAYAANFSKNIHSMPPTCELVQAAFVNGMISLAMATHKQHNKKSRPKRSRRQYIAEGKHMIQVVRKYALWAPANFTDKQLLLEAELAAVEGRKDQAMQHYTCAIGMSKVSRNIFVQGLANERTGRYCFSALNQPTIALSYFNEAVLVYKQWKAHRKVDHLQAEVKSMFGT